MAYLLPFFQVAFLWGVSLFDASFVFAFAFSVYCYILYEPYFDAVTVVLLKLLGYNIAKKYSMCYCDPDP